MNNMNIAPTDVAIIGMAGRFPDASNVNEFWNNLVNGVESVRNYSVKQLKKAGVPEEHLQNPNYIKAGVPFSEIDMFDAGFFGFSPHEAKIMDPQHRHFIEASWEALEDAGYNPDEYKGTIGIYGGCGMSSYFIFNLLSNPELVKSDGLFLLRHTGNDKDFLTTRVSYLFNLKGPSVNVQTACSTSLVAIHYAYQSLLTGECEIALAGGVTIDQPQGHGYIYQEGEILSPDGHCRAFDHNAQGTIFGSGVGVVVLKRLEDAIADNDQIHAVIKGSAINNDGSTKVGYLAPSVDGQAESIIQALASSDIDPETIDYIETHGTGTAIGDPIEVTALSKAYRSKSGKKQYCKIGSVKTNIGHLDTAAGVAGIIKTTMALKNKQIPPSLNYEKPNPNIDFLNSPFLVNDKLSDWKRNGHPRRAGVSSLGVGGTNAHIILEEAPELEELPSFRDWKLLTFSARTEDALNNSVSRFKEFLIKNKNINISDAAYTLQIGRKAFKYRKTLAVKDVLNAIEEMSIADNKKIVSGKVDEKEPNIVFVFPGGGVQYPEMGKELYASEKVFKQEIDKCFDILINNYQMDLRALIYPAQEKIEESAIALQDPLFSILSVFCIEYALAKLFISFGIKPSALLGHSLGEYTAACVSNVLSLEDALKIVYKRGKIFQKMPTGGMVSVNLSESEIEKYLNPNISIAAKNTKNLIVLSGSDKEIDSLQKQLDKDEVDYSRLKISVAAHSTLLDPFLDEFKEIIMNVKHNKPNLNYYSCTTTKQVNEKDLENSNYWITHLRHTVKFSDTLKNIPLKENTIFLEVGPGHSMTTLIDQHNLKDAKTITTVRHPKEALSDDEVLLKSIGKLWANGYNFNWIKYYGNEKRRKVSLPTYPFEHKSYWVKPGKGVAVVPEEINPLRKMTNMNDWFYRQSLTYTKPIIKNTEINNLITSELLFDLPGETKVLYNDLVNYKDRKLNLIFSCKLHLDEVERLETVKQLIKKLNEQDIDEYNITFITYNTVLTKYDNFVNEKDGIFNGAIKVLLNEYPNMKIKLVDLSIKSYNENSSKILLNYHNSEETNHVAIRNDEIISIDYENIDFNNLEKNSISFIDGGIYLITGGTGGMALTIAKHLLSKYKATVVLIGRKYELNTTAFNELSSLGGKLIYKKADVSQQDELNQIVQFIKTNYGKINGIFHTAGLIKDNLMEFKTKEEIEYVLEPKVKGTKNVIKIADELNPDFLFLFSSTSSFLGIPGQYDYAAANSFMNKVAYNNNLSKQYLTLSLNWGQWQKIGMAARIANEALNNGEIFLEDQYSNPFFKGFNKSDNVINIKVELTPEDWLVNQHVTKNNEKVLPGTGYIQLLDFALRHYYSSANYIIEELYFLSPLIVNDPVEFKISLEKNNDIIDFEIVDFLGNEHCRGSINLKLEVSEQKTNYADLFGDRELKVIDGKIYKHPFMNFGERWNVLNKYSESNNTVTAELELDRKYEDELTLFNFHPALLDVSIGVAQLQLNQNNFFYVPFSYKKIKFHSSLTSKIYCKTIILNSSDNEINYSIKLFNNEFKLIIEIDKFTLKKLEQSAFSSSESGTHKHKSTNSKIVESQKEGILPEEGINCIELLLKYRMPDQTIIMSQNIDAIIDNVKSNNENISKIELEVKRNVTSSLVEPRNETEKQIRSIWQDTLGINDIGVKDDFIELGGHSLLLTRVIMKTKKLFKTDLPINILFENPTVENFALEVEKSLNSSNSVSKEIKAFSRDAFKVSTTS